MRNRITSEFIEHVEESSSQVYVPMEDHRSFRYHRENGSWVPDYGSDLVPPGGPGREPPPPILYWAGGADLSESWERVGIIEPARQLTRIVPPCECP